MSDPSRYPDSADETAGDTAGDTGSGSDHVSGAPRWVKVVVIAAVFVALFFVVLQVAGGGGHGPGRHAGGIGGHAPIAQSS